MLNFRQLHPPTDTGGTCEVLEVPDGWEPELWAAPSPTPKTLGQALLLPWPSSSQCHVGPRQGDTCCGVPMGSTGFSFLACAPLFQPNAAQQNGMMSRELSPPRGLRCGALVTRAQFSQKGFCKYLPAKAAGFQWRSTAVVWLKVFAPRKHRQLHTGTIRIEFPWSADVTQNRCNLSCNF